MKISKCHGRPKTSLAIHHPSFIIHHLTMQIMKFKIFFLATCLLAFGQFGCKDFVEGINEDPNNPADAPMGAVLTAAQTSAIISHEGEVARLACLWSRQFTGADRQYAGFEVYTTSSGDFDWDMFYLIVTNADIVIEKAEAINDKLASGIAKVLKAQAMGVVTSLWGNVPFSEANRFPEIEDPKFDNQADVYAGVQSLLDEAVSDLAGGPTSDEINDLFFGGDAAKWEAVAHSLKARFYLHVGDYANAAASASKGLLDPTGDMNAPHTGGAYLLDQNIWFSFGVVDRTGYMTASSAVLPTLLDAASANYRGNAKTDETARFGFVFTGSEGSYDLNYEGMWTATSPYPMVTAAETHLVLAEAALRQDDLDGALTNLNNAREVLQAQFPGGSYQAYELADFDENGMAGIAGLGRKEALLHEIIEEKYCSLVGQIEVFNDLRRTNNLLNLPATQGNALPERLLIPQVEIDANLNVPSPIPGVFDPTPVNQ